jgi:predicted SAM-dependent methyltransferase
MDSTKNSVVAVNLGCGTSIAPGWINFDNSLNLRMAKIPLARWLLNKIGLLSKVHYSVKWPKEVQYRELTKPLPFKDSSVDFIYTSHFMEHLSLSDAKALFKEIYRVLKIGGVARIIVPDLKYDIDRYLENVKSNPSNAADIFLTSLSVSSKIRDPHLWLYDNHSIVDKLLKTGFSKVEESEYKKGLCKDVDILDNRPIVLYLLRP